MGGLRNKLRVDTRFEIERKKHCELGLTFIEPIDFQNVANMHLGCSLGYAIEGFVIKPAEECSDHPRQNLLTSLPQNHPSPTAVMFKCTFTLCGLLKIMLVPNMGGSHESIFNYRKWMKAFSPSKSK